MHGLPEVGNYGMGGRVSYAVCMDCLKFETI